MNILPHGQSTWHGPQKVCYYRPYINGYMVTAPSLVYLHSKNNAEVLARTPYSETTVINPCICESKSGETKNCSQNL